MDLKDLKVYNNAMEIGEKTWEIVGRWKYSEKDTLGKQLVRSIDPVAANLSEGFGRYHYAETKNFCYYARGSLYETKTWLEKANNRSLITESQFHQLSESIERLGKMLNKYIKSIGPSTND